MLNTGYDFGVYGKHSPLRVDKYQIQMLAFSKKYWVQSGLPGAKVLVPSLMLF